MKIKLCLPWLCLGEAAYLALDCLILESKMLYRLNLEKLEIEIHASDDNLILESKILNRLNMIWKGWKLKFMHRRVLSKSVWKISGRCWCYIQKRKFIKLGHKKVARRFEKKRLRTTNGFFSLKETLLKWLRWKSDAR